MSSRISHHILPTKENGYVPHVLRLWSLLLIFFVGLGLFSFVKLSEQTGGFGFLADVYPAVIETLTNADRADASLKPLSVSETLTKAAQLKANDMAANGYFAHTSPTGITPWYWFQQVGYQFRYAGENLAVNFDDSQTVQTAWLNSPTHKANIMNGNFSEIGVATAQGFYNGRQTTFVVEMFGAPAIAQPQPVATSALDQGAQTPEAARSASVQTSTSKQMQNKETVAGESTQAQPKDTISITKNTVDVDNTTISKTMVLENTDPAITPVPATAVTETIHIPWYKQLFLHSGTIAGAILSIIIILLFFATAAMVARNYEKHHVKHMVGGSVMMAVLLLALFAGRLGILTGSHALALRQNHLQVVQ